VPSSKFSCLYWCLVFFLFFFFSAGITRLRLLRGQYSSFSAGRLSIDTTAAFKSVVMDGFDNSDGGGVREHRSNVRRVAIGYPLLDAPRTGVFGHVTISFLYRFCCAARGARVFVWLRPDFTAPRFIYLHIAHARAFPTYRGGASPRAARASRAIRRR